MTAHPKFQWGISTLGCHELNLEEICKLAARHDIHALEIRTLEDRQDLPAYLDETYTDASEIQPVLDAHQQTIVALNSSFSLIKAQESDRDELLEFARWAEALGIPYIRAFGGGTMASPLTEQDLTRAAASLRWWHGIREQNGWNTQLVLETHDGFCNAERCLLLQNRIEYPLDIIWDTHHTWKLGNEPVGETWDLLSPLIRHVHIKDSISVPSARHPYTYVLPGTGEFPTQDVLALLSENHYEGIVSLEWERKWHPYMPPLEEALEALTSKGWKTEALALA